MKELLLGKTTNEISAQLDKLNEPAYKGKQISKWIYQRYVRDFEKMTDISKDLRKSLTDNFEISNSSVATKIESEDGTTKYLVKLKDGNTVECVNIFQPDHHTACLSTQVGCNVKCPFCATGLSGFKRNLTPDEILDQYLLMQGQSEERISQVVFMGMGEPFLNYDATLKSVHLLNKEVGIGMRHITISTSGIIRNIEKLMNEKLQLNLAVSLHSADDELRDRLVPINKNNPLSELFYACRKYADVTKRRITFEYVMLKDINDRREDLEKLITRLKGIHCHINLIPHNPIYSAEKFEATPMNKIKEFQRVLSDAGYPTTLRVSRGSSTDAACGQLSVIQGG
ncbi:MAG: 23S rRNA (adenine(2503)-C(2))-methyltransferase RlmN [Candidatus Sericytochromatia bacterium]|nr:23S rRNA (adenine(2503)-C(2))-methyltransferase RlmN [Candidatus Sericytochromatia bacterium]